MSAPHTRRRLVSPRGRRCRAISRRHCAKSDSDEATELFYEASGLRRFAGNGGLQETGRAGEPRLARGASTSFTMPAFVRTSRRLPEQHLDGRHCQGGKDEGSALPAGSRIVARSGSGRNVGCVHRDAEHGVDWLLPRPSLEHAAGVGVAGLPARLDRGL